MTTDEATRRQALTAAHHAGVRHDRGDVFLRAVDLAAVPRDDAGNLDADALAAAVRTVAAQVPELCRDGAIAHQGPRRSPVTGDGTVYGGAPPLPIDPHVQAVEIAAVMRREVGLPVLPNPASGSSAAVEATRLEMLRAVGLG